MRRIVFACAVLAFALAAAGAGGAKKPVRITLADAAVGDLSLTIFRLKATGAKAPKLRIANKAKLPKTVRVVAWMLRKPNRVYEVAAVVINSDPGVKRAFGPAAPPPQIDAELSRLVRGYRIAPVKLNLKSRNRALVGLGSYIVNHAPVAATHNYGGSALPSLANLLPYVEAFARDNVVPLGVASELGVHYCQVFGTPVPGFPDEFNLASVCNFAAFTDFELSFPDGGPTLVNYGGTVPSTCVPGRATSGTTRVTCASPAIPPWGGTSRSRRGSPSAAARAGARAGTT